MKKELLNLIGQLVGESVNFGIHEQYGEAGDELNSSSDRVYELTQDIVKLATGMKPTEQEVEEALMDSIGEQGMYTSEDEDENEF
jgi:hypothetical protein